MPTESDDDDHDVISASPTFVSVYPGDTATSDLPAQPTDHQHRPINAKPSDIEAIPTDVADVPESSEIPDEPEDGSQKDEHFLPHYFPTFGVNKRTQIWIYGAFGIIVLFCVGLGSYFFIVRRRRRRNQRDDYEFEALDNDADLDGATSGRRPRRRAGELYDAFAGESDEEQLLSDEEDEEDDEEEKRPYEDREPSATRQQDDGARDNGVNEKH